MVTCSRPALPQGGAPAKLQIPARKTICTSSTLSPALRFWPELCVSCTQRVNFRTGKRATTETEKSPKRKHEKPADKGKKTAESPSPQANADGDSIPPTLPPGQTSRGVEKQAPQLRAVGSRNWDGLSGRGGGHHCAYNFKGACGSRMPGSLL